MGKNNIKMILMPETLLLQLFQNNPYLWLTFVGLLSLFIGSFLNVVIHRLPAAMMQEWKHECNLLLGQNTQDNTPPLGLLSSISWPASHCPKCQAPLKKWHNIPLVSYLFLKGRCAFCAVSISPRYPIVELLTAVLSMAVAWFLGPSWEGIWGVVLVYFLVPMSFIDLDHKLLPDQLTLPLLWTGLIINSFDIFVSLESALWGAVIGYLSLWLVYWGFRLITGKHGMGYGDFKLLAALGAWLGWEAIPMVVLMSAIAGLIVFFGLRMRRTETDPEMPFGPMLALGGLAFLLDGDGILEVVNRLVFIQ
jgi:leader peptidase (prepilin peptidase)/N-methyltransferase